MAKRDTLAVKLRAATRSVHDLRTLCEQVCRVVVEDGEYRMAWVGRYDRRTGWVEPIASWGHDEGYVEKLRITVDQSKFSIGPTATTVRERRPVVNPDFRTSVRGLPWRDEALRRGYLSSAAFPVIVGDAVWGTVNVYAGTPGIFDEARVTALTELASELGAELARQVKPEPEPKDPA